MSTPTLQDVGASSKQAAEQEEHHGENNKVGIRQRLKHFTFAWFLSTMSTGGLAIALAETPHKFNGRVASITCYASMTSLAYIPHRSLPHRLGSLYIRSPTLSYALCLHGPALRLVPGALETFLYSPTRILLLRLFLAQHQRHHRLHPKLRHLARPQLPVAHRRSIRALLDLRRVFTCELYLSVLDIDAV